MTALTHKVWQKCLCVTSSARSEKDMCFAFFSLDTCSGEDGHHTRSLPPLRKLCWKGLWLANFQQQSASTVSHVDRPSWTHNPVEPSDGYSPLQYLTAISRTIPHLCQVIEKQPSPFRIHTPQNHFKKLFLNKFLFGLHH